jgi:hypothetical protein
MDEKIKLKGDKGTKGRKDKNKKGIYSSKHIRNQIQNKTTTSSASNTDKEKSEKHIKN